MKKFNCEIKFIKKAKKKKTIFSIPTNSSGDAKLLNLVETFFGVKESVRKTYPSSFE